jgi:predicted transcriptional regulator
VVTANFPGDLVDPMDEVAARLEQTKSWIVRQAAVEWLGEEQRRFELTLEGMRDFEKGWTIDHEDLLARPALNKAQARGQG